MNEEKPPAAEIFASESSESLSSRLRMELIQDITQMRRHRERAMRIAACLFWVSLVFFIIGAVVAVCLIIQDHQNWRAVYLMFPGAIAAFVASSAVRGSFRRDGEVESHWRSMVDQVQE